MKKTLSLLWGLYKVNGGPWGQEMIWSLEAGNSPQPIARRKWGSLSCNHEELKSANNLKEQGNGLFRNS